MIKMIHNNYNIMFCVRSKAHLKSTHKTVGMTFHLGHYFIAALLIASSLLIKLRFYSTLNMKSFKQNITLQSTDQHRITLIKSKQRFTTQQRRPRQHANDGYKNKPTHV